MYNHFYALSKSETSEINGGGILGAAIGFVGGVVVGTVACVVVTVDSMASGSNSQDAGKAGMTAFGATVLTSTVVCACVTGVF